MSAGHLTMTVHVHKRWWLLAYVTTLMLVARVANREPDMDKLADFIVKHGLKITYE